MDSSVFDASINTSDWVALAVFMALVIGFAAWAKMSTKGSEDFFLAGRSMGWFIVMMSTFATLFSTISFVMIPGEAFTNGMGMLLLNVPAYLFMPLGIFVVLRFYFHTETFSVYEYMEKRFNAPMRVLGSISFILFKAVYSASVFFAASKIFSSLVGWHPLFTILVIGTITVVYSTTGGMKAVMLTDLVQGIVVILGIAAIAFVILKSVNFDVVEIYQYAESKGHGLGFVAERDFWRLDFKTRICAWMFLWTWVLPIGSIAMDQSTIQRLLASKGIKPATKAMYGNMFLSIPVVLVLWIIGIGLFYFYNNGLGELPEGIAGDQVMGYFIRTQLPSPLPGLILAALLAALMSTIDSTMNAQANLIHRDVLIRFDFIKEGSKNEMKICRLLSLICGTIGIGLAALLYFTSRGSKATVFEIITVFGVIFAGMPITWAYIMGMLVPKISGKAILVSFFVGWCLNLISPFLFYYNVPEDQRISFLWLSSPGAISQMILPPLLSYIWRNRKDTTNLTIWTLKKAK